MSTQDDIIWYVVADGGKARILTRGDAGMTTISAFDAAGHGDTNEDDAAEISQIKAPRSDPGQQVKALFARQVAEHLNKAVNAHTVDSIVLAAPGHVLHDIREALSKPALQAVSGSLSKDLTNIADRDLASHFH